MTVAAVDNGSVCHYVHDLETLTTTHLIIIKSTRSRTVTMDPEPTPVFDNLDIDLVIKVLNHTLFSNVLSIFVLLLYLIGGRSLLRLAHTGLLFLPRGQVNRSGGNLSYFIPHCYLGFL